jgi:hypothetical protein
MWHYLFLIVTAVHAYVSWRAASVPVLARHRKVLLGVSAALWLSLFLPRVLDRSVGSAAISVLRTLGLNWMAVLFLACVSLLVVEVVTGFGFLLRRAAPALRGWALLAAAAMSAVGFVQGMRAPVVRSYEVRVARLPAALDGTVLVAASDFHIGMQGKAWLAARVTQIEALHPDLVALLGDIIEGDSPSERVLLPPLRRIRAPLGVWAVTGNHEYYAGFRPSVRLYEDAGFQVLRDRWASVRPGLVIAGVDDLTARQRRSGGDVGAVERAVAGRPAGATILLSHTPWQYEEAARAGVSLMLCAHTHGGQIWPFGWFELGLYPLMAGRYDVAGMPVIVSRGAGTWGPRMRLWRPGEILRITLRAPATP